MLPECRRSASGRRASGRPRHGAVAAELALTLPMLLLLTLGCIDFGRFSYSYIALANAARAGAAYGSMRNYPASDPAAWQAEIRAAALEEMQDQTGYDPDQIEVDVPTPTMGNGLVEANYQRRLRVTARIPFQTLVDWPGIPHTVNMIRTVEMRQLR